MVDSRTRSFLSKARLHYYVVFLSRTILALTLTTNKQGNLRGLLCWRRRPWALGERLSVPTVALSDPYQQTVWAS